jgi:hypothetical protein
MEQKIQWKRQNDGIWVRDLDSIGVRFRHADSAVVTWGGL